MEKKKEKERNNAKIKSNKMNPSTVLAIPIGWRE